MVCLLPHGAGGVQGTSGQRHGVFAVERPRLDKLIEDQGLGSAACPTITSGALAGHSLGPSYYHIDVFRCPVCGNRMSVIPVIRDPAEIRTIITCLVKHGRGPPDEG